MFPEIPTGILYSTQNNKEFGTHQSFLTKKIPPSSRNDHHLGLLCENALHFRLVIP